MAGFQERLAETEAAAQYYEQYVSEFSSGRAGRCTLQRRGAARGPRDFDKALASFAATSRSRPQEGRGRAFSGASV